MLVDYNFSTQVARLSHICVPFPQSAETRNKEANVASHMFFGSVFNDKANGKRSLNAVAHHSTTAGCSDDKSRVVTFEAQCRSKRRNGDCFFTSSSTFLQVNSCDLPPGVDEDQNDGAGE